LNQDGKNTASNRKSTFEQNGIYSLLSVANFRIAAITKNR